MKITWLLIWQCALMAPDAIAQPTNDTWVDKSPHQEAFAKVNGISLEYLDWGGRGEPLLFLAGLGNTAHIFDDMAPGFTNHFHNRPGWNDACESDLRNTRAMTPQGYSGHGSTPDSVEETLEKETLTAHNDYTKLTMPVLAFFADHQLDKLVDQAAAANRQQAEYFHRILTSARYDFQL